MTKLSRSLIIGSSILALAACGPEEIASPGTGGNVIINNPAPTPAPTPTPTPTQALVTPAGGCPTIADAQGLTDEGTITGPEGTWRVCTLPARLNVSSTLPRFDGLLYRIAGETNVGTDGGPAADASDGLSDTNVTLTIDPGVILYSSGSGFLNVTRGNRINAVGTPQMPIIFTSRDNVVGFNTNNPNASGQWGGVVLSGRAPVTDCIAPGATPGTVDCERQVEGAVNPALFGGASPGDSSGSMRYVQIRFSGFVLSGNSELQALTTGGTGRSTVLNHIQSVNSSDDGVEFFGGIVNIANLIVAGAEDDSLDTDTGVKANMQFVIAAQRPDVGDTIIEADSDNGLYQQTPRQNTTIANATFIQRNNRDQVIRIRGGTDYGLYNTLVIDASSAGTPCIRIDQTETIAATNPGGDEVGAPRFNSVALDCATDFRAGSSGVSLANTEAVFNAGTGNNASFTNTIVNGYLNGANETGFTPIFDVTTLNNNGFSFVATNFIGAVSPTDDWTQRWTCNSAAVSFGTNNTGDCTSIPVF
ncbi:hypothetical protein [Erythrobacter sp. EC-HK427]|uniref:hypothetical protein n=1 Tax=Erythrobacter sp. EC-HK427 TaxID=2038396 RepID=UPI001256D67E|nr:hypothetical protein [Erythrobacter sp. EC-HK427]VVT06729.1 conserved exported hypothetical protein [Erythrobacter sp. EC-HK427]